MKKGLVLRLIVIGAAVGATAVASATGGLDVSAATTELSGEVTTQMESVGVGIFTLSAIGMGISWIKATFFG